MEVDQIAMMLNLQELSHAGQQPFQISLQDSFPLQVESIVRRVPNKRLVCRGVWNNQPVYAKVFIGNDAAKYALRDKRGVACLREAGIATPALLYSSGTTDGKAEVLIFKEIEHSEDAEAAYEQLPSQAARLLLAIKLVREVAKHHNANLLQTDLYLKNFLIQNDALYTLDGDGIKSYSNLSKWQALKNLSILLSKFNVLELESWLAILVKTYAEVRCWQDIPAITVIKNLVNRHRKKIANQYADKKVFRNCTDVQTSYSNNCFLAISSQFSLISLPKNPQDCDALINSQQRLKSGNTCTVALARIDGVGIVIKRYNIKSFWHGVNRALRQTRAARSWANAYRLNILGIATAAPVALIEPRQFGLKSRAYFLSEYVDAPDLAEFFSPALEVTSSSEAITNIANLFYQLYLLQISHGDMKASNIKMQNNGPVLIDLDSMQQHQFSWAALNAHTRDLQRFMQNWQVSSALYNAFIEAFKVVYVDQQPLRLAHIIK